MTDPKTRDEITAAANKVLDPVPATPPIDPDELSDDELASVAGGFAPAPAVDDYSVTNFLEA